MKRINLALLAAAPVFSCKVFAAADNGSWLAQVQQADATWWEVAYNHCDEKKMNEMLADDMEFVHDEIGIYRGKKAFAELNMQNVCKYADRRREAAPGSMKYEALHNVRDGNKIYGAVVSGDNVFYDVQPGVPDRPISRAHYVHVMLFDGTSWKLSRAISWGHVPIFADKN
ncbi:MAG: nuclear transport factor 2 family protein [Burkholderiaceae bacterium]|nr:nuclear transport factor 2 family protein [Burkholderiaceae bacterium]